MTIDVSLVSSGHDVGDARLHRLVSALLHEGLTVQVMATGTPDFAPDGATAVVTEPRGGMTRRLYRALLWPWRAQGAVVIVLDPDAVPSAWLLRRRGKVIVADVHEDYVHLLTDRAWARGVKGALARAAMKVVTRMSGDVDMTVVADDHVPPVRARKRLVLKNTPYSRHLPVPSEPDVGPRALHVGDLRRSRGLFDMLDVIEALPNWSLDLVGPVAPADQALFQHRLTSLGARVRWHGRKPPQQSWAFAAGAWVGLSLLQDTPAFRDAIPSKVYEFISCGLPVIASSLPRQAELIERTGAGQVVSSVTQAIEVMSRYEHDHDLLLTHRQSARNASFVDDSKYTQFSSHIAALVRRA